MQLRSCHILTVQLPQQHLTVRECCSSGGASVLASIARRNLFEDIPRFLVAQAGVMFAVSLVSIQTGILNGFTRSTALLIDQSQADIWVGSQDMVYFELTKPLAAGQVTQARQVPGVAQAEAIVLQGGRWNGLSEELSSVRIIGLEPDGQLFQLQNLQSSQLALSDPQTIAVDRVNLSALNLRQVGDIATINGAPAKLVGITQGTQSIASSPFVFTSLENANAYAAAGLSSTVKCDVPPTGGGLLCTTVYERPHVNSAGSPPIAAPKPLSATDPITYVLIKAQPGQDLAALKQRIEATLPATHAYTRTEMANLTRNYWQQRTGVGFILGLGATVGVIVGMVIVGQILYSSVSDHLKEFGTLKAMGASNWVIYRIIVEQALWMAVLGYIPSMIFCQGLGVWTYATQGITILITPTMATGLLGLTVVMCVGSALFAIQKVTHVDPAIVFKA
jgi:putative ABC transport system permease protein